MLSMIRPYERYRDFERLTGKPLPEDDTDILPALEKALKRERRLASEDKPYYCCIRHMRLLMALKAEGEA